jgi:hypothetical protein
MRTFRIGSSLITLAAILLVAAAACSAGQSSNGPGPSPDAATIAPTVAIPQAGPTTVSGQPPPQAVAPFTPAWGVPAERCEPTAIRPTLTIEAIASVPTRTPQPSLAPLPPFRPPASPALIGEAVPDAPGPITAANYARLRQVAQWGRGRILGVAYTPAGDSFVV